MVNHMIFKEKRNYITPEVHIEVLQDIFVKSETPLKYDDIKRFHVYEFSIHQTSKYLARENSIDIKFDRSSKENAEMNAKVKMRFVGRLNIPYEVNINFIVEYTNKFTLDCYIKNAMWTYIYSLLVVTDELTRLYPSGMKIPTELYVDDKIQPALELISNYK